MSTKIYQFSVWWFDDSDDLQTADIEVEADSKSDAQELLHSNTPEGTVVGRSRVVEMDGPTLEQKPWRANE